MFAFLVWPLNRCDLSWTASFHLRPCGFRLSACLKVCSKQACFATFLFWGCSSVHGSTSVHFCHEPISSVGGQVAVNFLSIWGHSFPYCSAWGEDSEILTPVCVWPPEGKSSLPKWCNLKWNVLSGGTVLWHWTISNEIRRVLVLNFVLSSLRLCFSS